MEVIRPFVFVLEAGGAKVTLCHQVQRPGRLDIHSL